jgi:hypothetical protein
VGLRPPLLAACADVIADTRFAPTGTLILPRGAHAPRSWLHDATLTAKSDIVDGHTHTHEERRASARRGNGVELWMVNRNSPTGSRTHQERRASARRGNETHLQWREFFPERVRSRSTGGLRPPLLAACADVIADTRFAPTGTLILPRGAYASRSWLHDATLTAKSDIVDGHTHTHEERRASARRGNGVELWMVNRNSPTGSRTHQERRASARRGNETHLQWREFFPERVRSRSTGGLRPPLLAACADVIADTRFAPTGTLILPRGAYASRSWLHDATLTAKSDIVDAHTHTHTRRAAGVSPPWCDCMMKTGKPRC